MYQNFVYLQEIQNFDLKNAVLKIDQAELYHRLIKIYLCIRKNLLSIKESIEYILKFVCKNSLIFIRTSGGGFEAVSINFHLLYTSFHLERGCDVFEFRVGHRLHKRIHVLFVSRMKDRT